MDPSPRSSDSALPGQEPYVVPNPSTPKTVGLLNIIFATLLLLCGLCWGMQLLMQSAMVPMMSGQMQQAQSQIEAQRQKRLDDLQSQIEAAATDEEKAALQAQHDQLQSQPAPAMPDMSKMWGLGDPRVIAYSYADLFSGMALNVAMLAAGIGLMQLREWGRQAAIWVAAIKIVRLVLVEGYFIFAIVPVMVQQTTEMYQEMGQQMQRNVPPGQPAPDFAQVGNVFGIMWVVSAVAMVALGVIYPAIVLWLLTRPAVKAACR